MFDTFATNDEFKKGDFDRLAPDEKVIDKFLGIMCDVFGKRGVSLTKEVYSAMPEDGLKKWEEACTQFHIFRIKVAGYGPPVICGVDFIEDKIFSVRAGTDKQLQGLNAILCDFNYNPVRVTVHNVPEDGELAGWWMLMHILAMSMSTTPVRSFTY